MESPLVSIVIPMYNSSETIEEVIQSVLNQTYKKWELIIVNDGSTDQSVSIVESIIKNNPQFVISLINKPNGGVSTARNAGMKAAKGDYIALLDSDDEWLPTKIEKQMQMFKKNPEFSFLGCTRNGEEVVRFYFKRFQYLTPISPRVLLYKNFFSTPTVVFKKEILSTIGYFDETQRYAEEGNYWIRIGKRYKCALLNESLVMTGKGKPNFGHSGLSSNLLQMETGELKNLKDALVLKIIGHVEYIALIGYSVVKYLRRVIIVKMRK